LCSASGANKRTHHTADFEQIHKNYAVMISFGQTLTDTDKSLQAYVRRTQISRVTDVTRMWANAHRDGRHAEHTWRPLFNAAKFG